MEFRFETEYNAKTLPVMARALRKTVRKKKSRRTHILGWLLTALCVVLILIGEPGFRRNVSVAAAVVMWLTMIFEDRINGFFAKKRMLPGTEKAVTVFSEAGYVTETEAGKTEWKYDTIIAIAESREFFVFLLSMNHGQLYDKGSVQGGTAEEFRRFLEENTGKPIQSI